MTTKHLNGDNVMKILLRGGRVVDPAANRDGVCDVLIDGETIVQLGSDVPVDGAAVIDVPAGCVVCPGFIDMHVHLREPGQEHKETIATGTAAAAAGGFTAVACMPNTQPVNDSAGITGFMLGKAAAAGQARVYPIGAITRGSKGEQLADLAELRAAGCVAVSDDGHPVPDALLMRRALEYAGMIGIPVIDHCEDPSLRGGSAHEGYHASRLGLGGLPAVAEELIVERDVTLAGLTGAPVHVAHMSVRGALRAVRSGKDRGIGVTCEVAPHHFVLTDESLEGYDTNVKMNPPLREAEDRDALLEGLADGAVDVIATDHAPHHDDEKAVEFDQAPFGIIGLETAVSLSLDRLVHRGVVSLGRLVELCATNPARILGVPGGTLAAGGPADLTILAPDVTTTVDVARMRSMSKNTPFGGWALRGAVAATIVAGRTIYVNDTVFGAEAFG